MNRLPRYLRPFSKAGLAVAVAASLGYGSAALAQTPVGAQPTLPPTTLVKSKPASPVVDTIAATAPREISVHKNPTKRVAQASDRHHPRHRHDRRPINVERPALAGVMLVEPLPPRIEAPRKMVPTPAYFVDGIAAAFTIPPPPIVCERRPRDRTLPDPRLYREVPVECGYDID
jgi:hypothetical protein